MHRSTLLAVCAAALAARGGADAPSSVPGEGTVLVTNDAAYPFASLFVAPQSQKEWGLDQLEGPLASGATVELEALPAGRYDLMARGPAGETAYAWGRAVDSGATTRVTLR